MNIRQTTLRAILAVALVLSMTGCGGGSLTGSFSSSSSSQPQGAVFIIGTDAPLGSVLAFTITVTGLTASDGTNNVSLISAPQDVEFSRLNGLRTLLDFQSVPAGTYTSITATLASPVISFLDVTTAPPSVQTINGTLVRSSITVTLRQSLVVTASGLVGLHVDFRIRDSLQLDSSGQITGVVDPHIAIKAVSPNSPDAEIDELRGGVVSVDLAAGSFIMQGPHGRQITVLTDAQTQFDHGESLSSLDTNTIVEVSGVLQTINLTLKATEVEVLSHDRFLLGGLITDVRPPSGPATQIDLLVRSEIPVLAGVSVGRITSLSFDGNEQFLIHDLHLPIGTLLFNSATLVPGQRVAVGGALLTSTTPPGLDVRRVVLHRQGLEGAWIPGSTNVQSGNNGSFDFRTTGLQGQVLGQSVHVLTSGRTRFGNLNGLADLNGSNPIRLRVVGLVLKDPVTGNAVVIASAVEKL